MSTAGKVVSLLTKERSKKFDVIFYCFNILISIIVIYVAFKFVHSRDILKYANEGYIAIFVATLLGSATIFLPAPNIAIILSGGILFNPLLAGIFGGLGWALGEFTGYYVGRYSGRFILKSNKLKKYYNKAEGYIDRWGLKVIFVFSIIPNPAFDAIGMAAGAYKIHPLKFMGACISGKIIGAVTLSMLAHYGFLRILLI